MEVSDSPGKFRPPKQTRSQQTLDRIAEAALTLMEERGVEGATVADIVNRAQASVGSFYARFPGKDDLIRYLRIRVWTEARERWDDALRAESWEGHSTEAVVEGVVGLLLRSFRADYHRRRVLGREATPDAESAAQRLDFHRHILETVTPLLMDRKEDLTHPEPVKAIRFGYRFVVGGIREFLELEEGRESLKTFSEDGEVEQAERVGGPGPAGPAGWGSPDALPGEDEVEDEDLGAELARAWMGYLAPGQDEGLLREEGRVDFFDPWG